MSECRAITNLIGNAVATIVVSRWENEISPADLQRNMTQQASIAAPVAAKGL